jgi:hypothetical protein
MKPASKVGVVMVGYIVAAAVATGSVAIRVANTSGPDAQAASGMYAFGDAILFVAVFGFLALLPTAAALYFLRPYPRFWKIISGLGLALAATGVAAAVVYALGRQAVAPSPLAAWAAFSVLRLLVAPLFTMGFFLLAFLSPDRFPRLMFVAATAMEAAVSAYVGIVWFLPLFFNR